jgi:cell wall-associated NlpC family hydrolase
VIWRNAGGSLSRGAVLAIIGVASIVLLTLLVAPMMIFASGGFDFESGSACSAARGQGSQPPPSSDAKDSIPANYFALFRSTGAKYGVPWVVLAGIGEVESDDGRSKLPGVHSGWNAFGAAGPMQIGVTGASGDTWGGAPIHLASEKVNGVATDATGGKWVSVYNPADAIAGAAKYLLEHGIQNNVQGAIFAYNHLQSYVQTVLQFAGTYAKGGYTISPVTLDDAPSCVPDVVEQTPNAVVASIIAYAQQQLGKPYQWGGTGPDSFDCSGLVMMAYRAGGIDIPRTSQDQWAWGPKIKASQVEPGDLVFFVGSDGTWAAPGHVGLVIGGGKMIEAYATGFPIRIATYTDRDPVGFTRPWLHRGVTLPALAADDSGSGT